MSYKSTPDNYDFHAVFERIADALEAQTKLLEENLEISRAILVREDEFTAIRKQEVAMQEAYYKKQERQARFLAATHALAMHQHLEEIHRGLSLPLKDEDEE